MNQLDEVKNYYSEKIVAHGASPKGVDWNGEDSQVLRFQQLTRIIDLEKPFTVNDFGCGYGALFDFIKSYGVEFKYFGNDISPEMIQEARKRITCVNASLAVAERPRRQADYTVASGVFNVALNITNHVWKSYILNQLQILDESSSKGFAFNCLTSYSDEDRKRDYLYYADPCEMFDFCKKHFSRNVALLHDYDLYEFTILVRKT